MQRGAGERFDRNDLCPALGCSCDASVESTAAHRDDDGVDLWFVLENFLGEGAGACRDLKLVVGVG